MNGLQGFGLVCLIAGGFFVLRAGRAMARRRRLLSRAVRTKGRVIDLKVQNSSSDSGNSMITPLVRYKANGHIYERQLAPTHEEDLFQVGAKVALLYERDNPAHVTDVKCRWEDVCVSLVMSLLLFLFGALLYFCTVDARE